MSNPLKIFIYFFITINKRITQSKKNNKTIKIFINYKKLIVNY